MYHWGLLLLFFTCSVRSIAGNFLNHVQECSGGYCLPRKICSIGTNDQAYLTNNLITLRTAGSEECDDPANICCQSETVNQIIPCSGGLCAPTYMCLNGTLTGNVQQESLITLRFGEFDECTDYILKCCKYQSDVWGEDIPKSTERSNLPKIDNTAEPDYSCGKKSPEIVTLRIDAVQRYAQYGEYPWVVAILKKADNDDLYVGGATLIHPRFVVTAAHIIHNQTDKLFASFGMWDMHRNKEVYDRQTIAIEGNYIVHPNYTSAGLLNDIALLKLEKEVVYDKHIRPICLPSPTDVFDNQVCTATGWGKETNDEYPNVLKRVDLPIIARPRCKQLLAATVLGPFYRLHKSFLCAGGEDGVDTCDGDGGSALACQTASGTYVLAGIVSWGLSCFQKDVPAAYVNVARFVDWIDSITND